MCRVDELAVGGHDEPVAAMLDWGGCIRWRGGAARGPGPREAASAGGVSSTGLSHFPRPGGGWGATTPSRAEMTPSPQGPPGRRRPVRRRRAAQPSSVVSRPAGARSRGPSHRPSSAPPSSIGSSCSSCADAVSGLARPCAVRVHPGGLADVVRPKRDDGGCCQPGPLISPDLVALRAEHTGRAK